MSEAVEKGAAMGFRRTLWRAANEEYECGCITRQQKRQLQAALLLRPRKVREAQERVEQSAASAGLMRAGDGDAADFDWEALLNFIKELLPVILQIIALF